MSTIKWGDFIHLCLIAVIVPRVGVFPMPVIAAARRCRQGVLIYPLCSDQPYAQDILAYWLLRPSCFAFLRLINDLLHFVAFSKNVHLIYVRWFYSATLFENMKATVDLQVLIGKSITVVQSNADPLFRVSMGVLWFLIATIPILVHLVLTAI